ncbi:MAG: 3-isopropylmalate dehydratase small subunit [Enterobacterales bacterium]|nr:3-isopropylmalate dehydratase small subunit [Enterobacterales bacterium]
MKAFNKISSVVAVINRDNIDTDQIIGSDHLKITDKEGLGKHLFADWRYIKEAASTQLVDNPNFVLNQAATKDAQVLVAGDNFGCGSSREHAPWALLDHGIKAVISSSIADIFSNNAIKNGFLPIQVGADAHQFLLAQNGQAIGIDLETQKFNVSKKPLILILRRLLDIAC